ncbi:leucine-rich repeat-containing protein 9-like [Schistocerca gregaria]|uniref:leucine-rich repeat-containing protein 9-like n=1 Tax=Schistocerca gregaria TaxID=7010 RepID=UPI00211ED170|nr:leucine-rich repeat-containing protein 9-like [Schistocerca gregaria]
MGQHAHIISDGILAPLAYGKFGAAKEMLHHMFAKTSEQQLQNVSAVEECYHLEKLCLYSNVIQEIPDLKHVQKLQTLWLSGNEISCIKNLESQKNLCELYLNNNKIKEIGSSLKENKNLHTLNLAANPIFSLKEIISLAELPSLTSLILADSQHDMQPMTELLNYSSYIIYHLNKLEILDGYPVDQRERSRVTLFYSNLLLQFRILKYKLLGDYYKEIWIKQEENREALARFRKWYQIYMSLAAQLERGEELKCNLQRDDIKTRLDYLSIEVKNWDAEVAEYMAFLSTMRKIRLTQLDYELENANNLKFIGYEADTEIVDIFNTIMNSYCCSHIERQYDIVGIQVIRVTQIVNNSFKAMMNSYSSHNLSRDAIMLVNPTPVSALSDWPFQILEKGFMVNKPLSVSVTDCLDFADASWMSTLHKLRQRNISLTDQIQNSIRVTVIVKLPEENPFPRNREQLYKSEEDQEQKSSNSDEATGLHILEPTDPKKCQVYHISDSNDIIPVYVVEFKYKYKEDKLKLLQQNMGLDVHSCCVSIQEPYTETCKLSLETLESYLPRPILTNFLREIRLVGCNIRTLGMQQSGTSRKMEKYTSRQAEPDNTISTRGKSYSDQEIATVSYRTICRGGIRSPIMKRKTGKVIDAMAATVAADTILIGSAIHESREVGDHQNMQTTRLKNIAGAEELENRSQNTIQILATLVRHRRKDRIVCGMLWHICLAQLPWVVNSAVIKGEKYYVYTVITAADKVYATLDSTLKTSITMVTEEFIIQ